jgi:hypothetical protein
MEGVDNVIHLREATYLKIFVRISGADFPVVEFLFSANGIFRKQRLMKSLAECLL